MSVVVVQARRTQEQSRAQYMADVCLPSINYIANLIIDRTVFAVVRHRNMLIGGQVTSGPMKATRE